MKKVLLFFALALILGLVATQVVYAGSDQAVMDKLEQLKKSVQMQQEQIGILYQQLEEQKALSAESRETDLAEVKKVVIEQLGGADVLPEWVKRIKISSDMRIRYHGYFDREGDKADRHDPRFRWRFYLEGKVTDEITAYVATSTNWNEGSAYPPKTSDDKWWGAMGTSPFGVIRTYLDYRPKDLPGSFFGAGKYAKNFLHTLMTWDPDTNPAGVYTKLALPLGSFTPWIYGTFIMWGEAKDVGDPTLGLVQAGVDIKITPDVKWTVAGSYYGYGGMNAPGVIRVGGVGKTLAQVSGSMGNTIDVATGTKYAYGYELWEGITILKAKVQKIPISLTFDWITNSAENVPSNQDTGIFAALKFGENKKKGDFSVELAYYKIEPDAVWGRINDSDLMHSNVKGYFVRAGYNLTDRLFLRVTPLRSEPVEKGPAGDYKVDTPIGKGTVKNEGKYTLVQVDLVYKF
ncbi:MAG: putative porin [Nitrospirota bacterium]|nr:putative porin [Nitrospirota bacterium]